MKIPYVKAINKETEKEIKGFYIEYPETTYCFSEDYNAFPIKLKKCIVFHEMTDWGLPNRLMVCDSIDESTLQIIGYVDTDISIYSPSNWIIKDK